MSLDLEIWSVKPLAGIQDLPSAASWTPAGSGWTYVKKNWQIVVEQSIEVDEEDVPPHIATAQVGVSFLTRVMLEPIHAPDAARSLIRKVARAIAHSCHGSVFDPQSEIVTATPGKVRPVRFEKGETIDLLKLSWWFQDGPLTTKTGARDLIKYFETHFPQFLPRRYGTFEPPEFRFEPDNIEHFLDFLLSEPLITVWYTRGKLFGVRYDFRSGWRWLPGPEGYYSVVPHLELSCPAKLLEEPGWEIALTRCWKTVSKLARPFYGDVRVLGGYHFRGNSIWVPEQAQSHPVRGSWRGLPRTYGVAAVIGEPYFKLMPDFVDGAEVSEGLAFRSLETWRGGGEVTSPAGPPPSELCQPGEPRRVEQTHRLPDGSEVRVEFMEWPQTYAQIWPLPPRPA